MMKLINSSDEVDQNKTFIFKCTKPGTLELDR